MSELNLDSHGTLHSANETEEVPLFRFAAVLAHADTDAPTDPLLKPLEIGPVGDTSHLQAVKPTKSFHANEIPVAESLEAIDEKYERSKTNGLKKQILTGIGVILIFTIGVSVGRFFSQTRQSMRLPAITLTPIPHSTATAIFAPTNRSLAKVTQPVNSGEHAVVPIAKHFVNNINRDQNKRSTAPNAIIQTKLAVYAPHVPKSDASTQQTPETLATKKPINVTAHVLDISNTARHDAIGQSTRKTIYKPSLTLPIIARFDITPSVIPMGSDATLCILVRNAVSVHVSVIGKVPAGYFACRTIAPWRTTTYTVIAKGYEDFSAATSATVHVVPRIRFR